MNLNNKIMFLRTLADGWDLYANSTFTADNPSITVQNKRPGVYARSTDTTAGTPWFVRFDAGSAGAFDPDDLVAWIGYLKSDGTAPVWRVRTSTVSDFSTTTYDSLGISMDSPFGGRTFVHGHKDGITGLASRYIEIAASVTAGSYIDVGRIMIGEPWQPVRNVILRGRTEPTTREKVAVSSGSRGQEFDIPGTNYLIASASMVFSSEADLKDEWADLIHRVGQSGNVLYCADPSEVTRRQQQYVSGRLAELSMITQVEEDQWPVSFRIEEYH